MKIVDTDALNSASSCIRIPMKSLAGELLCALLRPMQHSRHIRTASRNFVLWDSDKNEFVDSNAASCDLRHLKVHTARVGWFIMSDHNQWFLIGDMGMIEHHLGWKLTIDPHVVQLDEDNEDAYVYWREARRWLIECNRQHVYGPRPGQFMIKSQDHAVEFKSIFG